MVSRPLHWPKACIQVLEEDPLLRAGLCAVLSDAGYALAGDMNGANPASRIDLVLVGLDARQTPTGAPHLFDRAVPVILLVDRAAWTGFDFLDAANDLGALAVLSRPFSRSILLRLVADVLPQSGHKAGPAEDDEAERPGLAELLLGLENSNLA
jgi:hypothetical protein